jgi:putative ABC transport system permease protein
VRIPGDPAKAPFTLNPKPRFRAVIGGESMIVRLAWRSIWRNRRRTLITMTSIGLGLTIAIFFIAMAEGIYSQVVEEAVRMQAGHITLENPGYQAAPSVDLWIGDVETSRNRIREMAAVEQTKLLIWGQGVANSGAGGVGVSVMGVEPSVEIRTSPLARHIVAGGYLEDVDDRKVVIGEHLAGQLKVQVGSKIVLTTNNARGQLVEELCRVKGIFRTGSNEIDGTLIQIPITFARQVFGMGPHDATQLGVILKRPDDQKTTMEAIEPLCRGKDIAVLGWQEILPEVASYIRLDRVSNWVYQGLLFMIILFTILNTLLMSVVEREREFAVLLALGTPAGQLQGQLFMESVFIGSLGCITGTISGSTCALALQIWGLDLASLLPEGITVSGFALSTTIHALLTVSILLWTGGIVLGATTLLSFLPMRRITRVQLAETLR